MSEEEKPLDYIRALFGYADKAGAYRSRISFGDCSAEGNVKEQKRVSLTLAGPKPSYYKNYVVEGKHYNKDDFKLRGYKQYWFKKDIEKENSNIKENVATKIAPLPAGTVFSGVIRFKNLSETELGLLLWCIRLNDKGFHGIGMAKPYGYGRVKMEVEELKVLNMDKLYDRDSLESDPFETFNDDIQRKYIEEYKKYASKNIKSQNKSDKKNRRYSKYL